MYLHIVIEGPWSWRPSFHRSTISTRFMWGCFAVAKIHVSEHEYATTAYDWLAPQDWTPPEKYAGERYRRVRTRGFFRTTRG